MNTKKILLPGILMLTLSCSTQQEKKSIETNDLALQNQLQEKSETDCFDVKMEKWYISFNQLQDKGLNMIEADKKAVEISNAVFSACQSSVEAKKND